MRTTLPDGTKVIQVDHLDPRAKGLSWSDGLRSAGCNARGYDWFYHHQPQDIAAGRGYWVKDEGPAPAAVATSILTTDKKVRKETPIATGVVDYFPRAMAYVAQVSFAGNQQHNPGQPLHWDRTKSMDHPDCIMRHLIERGTTDDDGLKHSGKLAWRALALLELELELEAEANGGR